MIGALILDIDLIIQLAIRRDLLSMIQNLLLIKNIYVFIIPWNVSSGSNTTEVL